MNCQSLSAFALLALAGVATVSTALAQQISIVQNGADGWFERQIDPETAISGFEPASFRRLRAETGAVIARLAAASSVNTPPAPVCRRLLSSGKGQFVRIWVDGPSSQIRRVDWLPWWRA